MKKYALHPGEGRIRPTDEKTVYINAQLLAAVCYHVPFSECMNMEDPFIRKMASVGAKFDHLIHLVPKEDGVYRIPKPNENRLILSTGAHEKVNRSG